MSQVGELSPAAEGPAARESGTQALDRALSVLLAFRGGSVERKVSDVSRELGLHKSTASRLFRALADTGFLQRNEETGAYRLGVTVFELGARFLEGLDMHALARPLLHQLAQDEGSRSTCPSVTSWMPCRSTSSAAPATCSSSPASVDASRCGAARPARPCCST